jgi:UDP-MurNAc hydroxylase
MQMNMTIKFIGHAGFIVRSGDDVLIMDPWLSSAGAFDSAWFQFPCNHDLFHPVAQAIREACNPAIYISHEHKDHFDSGFLGAVVERQPAVFIADFSNKRLQRELQALGFQNIIEAGDGKELRHGALKLHIFVDDNAINRDSAIRVSDGSAAFLNLNDCKMFDRLALIRRQLGPIDVFTCQFSGATWHPTCYKYDAQVYRQISLRKQHSKFRSVLEAIRKVEPRRYLASAGPACFLDAALIEKNFEPENIFPRQPKLLAFLKPKLSDIALDPVGPGDVLDVESNTFTEHGRERCDEDEFGSYIYRYRDRVDGALAAISREKSEGQCRAIFDALVGELGPNRLPFLTRLTRDAEKRALAEAEADVPVR